MMLDSSSDTQSNPPPQMCFQCEAEFDDLGNGEDGAEEWPRELGKGAALQNKRLQTHRDDELHLPTDPHHAIHDPPPATHKLVFGWSVWGYTLGSEVETPHLSGCFGQS